MHKKTLSPTVRKEGCDFSLLLFFFDSRSFFRSGFNRRNFFFLIFENKVHKDTEEHGDSGGSDGDDRARDISEF